jgi:hypothetical protein
MTSIPNARAVTLTLCLFTVSAAAAQQSAPSAPPGEFELLPEPPKPDASELLRQKQVEDAIVRRRTLLTVHQAVGLAMLASLATTVVLGQLNYQDKYGGGGDTGRWYAAHEDAALVTSALFVTAGTLSLLAPNPIEKKVRLDSATLHKVFMGIAGAGFAAEIVLGVVTASKEGQISQRDFALAHQIIGYSTLGAAAAGFTVLTF